MAKNIYFVVSVDVCAGGKSAGEFRIFGAFEKLRDARRELESAAQEFVLDFPSAYLAASDRNWQIWRGGDEGQYGARIEIRKIQLNV